MKFIKTKTGTSTDRTYTSSDGGAYGASTEQEFNSENLRLKKYVGIFKVKKGDLAGKKFGVKIKFKYRDNKSGKKKGRPKTPVTQYIIFSGNHSMTETQAQESYQSGKLKPVKQTEEWHEIPDAVPARGWWGGHQGFDGYKSMIDPPVEPIVEPNFKIVNKHGVNMLLNGRLNYIFTPASISEYDTWVPESRTNDHSDTRVVGSDGMVSEFHGGVYTPGALLFKADKNQSDFVAEDGEWGVGNAFRLVTFENLDMDKLYTRVYDWNSDQHPLSYGNGQVNRATVELMADGSFYSGVHALKGANNTGSDVELGDYLYGGSLKYYHPELSDMGFSRHLAVPLGTRLKLVLWGSQSEDAEEGENVRIQEQEFVIGPTVVGDIMTNCEMTGSTHPDFDASTFNYVSDSRNVSFRFDYDRTLHPGKKFEVRIFAMNQPTGAETAIEEDLTGITTATGLQQVSSSVIEKKYSGGIEIHTQSHVSPITVNWSGKGPDKKYFKCTVNNMHNGVYIMKIRIADSGANLGGDSPWLDFEDGRVLQHGDLSFAVGEPNRYYNRMGQAVQAWDETEWWDSRPSVTVGSLYDGSFDSAPVGTGQLAGKCVPGQGWHSRSSNIRRADYLTPIREEITDYEFPDNPPGQRGESNTFVLDCKWRDKHQPVIASLYGDSAAMIWGYRSGQRGTNDGKFGNDTYSIMLCNGIIINNVDTHELRLHNEATEFNKVWPDGARFDWSGSVGTNYRAIE